MTKFLGTKLKGAERYKKLYHYTSFDTFVKIWLTKQLKFGAIANVNDIQEASVSACSDPDKGSLILAYQDIRLSYKQISFTMDYDTYIKGCMSPMMWGHYGDKSNGVCIEFDFDKIKFSNTCLKKPVNYKSVLNRRFVINNKTKSSNDLGKSLLKNANTEFFTKQLDWKGENEYRVVSASDDFLDISNAISAVYLTKYDSLECKLTEELVKEDVPVLYLCYSVGAKNKAFPILKNVKERRESLQATKSNPENVLNSFSQQYKDNYEAKKHDVNADLTMDILYVGNKKTEE